MSFANILLFVIFLYSIIRIAHFYLLKCEFDSILIQSLNVRFIRLFRYFLSQLSLEKLNTMRRSLYLSIFLFSYIFSFAQVANVQFGKNRVQYHQEYREWLQYESWNFVTYWYGTSQNIGKTVVLLAEKNYKEVESILDHRINNKIEIIVYKDLSDLNQSNIGSEEIFYTEDGKTKVYGNKMFVYFAFR